LSGGLDSRCCAGAANRAGISFDSYTFGKKGCADRVFAGDVAKLYGSNHHDWDYEYDRFASGYDANIRVTEGLTNYTDCHMMNHRHKLKGAADIILNGYGGDQALGGSFLRAGWMHGLDADALAATLYAWRNQHVPDANLGEFIAGWDAVPAELRPDARYRELMRGVGGSSSADMALRFYLSNRTRRMIAIGTTMMRLVTESA